MANVELHELTTSEQLSSSDVIAEQREDSGLWLTRKVTLNALGLFLNNVLNFASQLQTTNKTIIGAINEITPVKLEDTLEAGETTITFSDPSIDSDSFIDVYAPVWYSSIVADDVNHEVTITFPVQASDITVKVRIS